MSGFEWFLLVVVVILVPLVVAVMITLWTLEQARKRNRKNRPADAAAGPVKRKATRAEPPAAVAEMPANDDDTNGPVSGSESQSPEASEPVVEKDPIGSGDVVAAIVESEERAGR